jgi:hypothetical protein
LSGDGPAKAGSSQLGFQELDDLVRTVLAVRFVEKLIADGNGFGRIGLHHLADIIDRVSKLHFFLWDGMLVGLQADIEKDYEIGLNAASGQSLSEQVRVN